MDMWIVFDALSRIFNNSFISKLTFASLVSFARVQFEGLRQPEDLMRFWQNYLHPSINKSTWQQDEISKLEEVADKYKQCHWDKIAEALGVSVTKEVVLCWYDQ